MTTLKYSVKLSARAVGDLRAIRAYIGDEGSPRAAQNMAERLVAAVTSLADHPLRGRPVENELRELTTIPPYVIRYRVRLRAVEVIRIKHGAQRPS